MYEFFWWIGFFVIGALIARMIAGIMKGKRHD